MSPPLPAQPVAFPEPSYQAPTLNARGMNASA